MKRLAIVLVTLLILVYPFIVFIGINHYSPKYIAVSLALVILLRFILANPSKSGVQANLLLVTGAGLGISLFGIVSNQVLVIKLYPVVISFLLFGIFFFSLLHPPTVIEKIARITTPELPRGAIIYIEKVTRVWCIFFVVNGVIALWTATFASMKVWAFYNGFLSYIVIGVIFVTEFIYRRWAKNKSHI